MTIKRLLTEDDTWEKFESDWKRQSKEIFEDYDDYASEILVPIKKIAQQNDENTWAASVEIDGRHTAAFMIILANQKGYDGPVLRIRHIVVCPLLDAGVLSLDTYANTLVSLLFDAVNLSESILVAKHIKMHVRSPADLDYFRALNTGLDKSSQFESTELKGSWLTITKN